MMDILDKLVIPPNIEHVALLNVLLIMTLIVFLPFIGMLTGGMILSLYYKAKGRKESNENYIRFSKEVLAKTAMNKSVGYGLAVLPSMTITFIYAQLLYGAKTLTVSLMVLAVILYAVSVTFIYKYKETFQLEGLIKSVRKAIDKNSIPGEVKNLEDNIYESNSRAGSFGIAFLLTASFVFIGATTLAMDSLKWQSVTNILELLISGATWINFLYYISASFVITSGAVLYLFFNWEGGVKDMSEDYGKFVGKTSVTVALIASFAQVLLLLANFFLLPQSALSGSVFVYAILALISILLVCNILYAIWKNSEFRYSGAVFFLVILTFSFTIVKDQLALGNSLKQHLLTVEVKAEELAKEKTNRPGSNTAGIDGEAIYNSKCSACHKFDQKLVGPPYQETVPKYNGDVKKLAGFIYNPVKMNASYPPMPNQGLKMKEAEAVAQFLISKVGKK